MALPVSRLVRVQVNLAPLAAARRSFGVLMIAGDSDVINGLERFRTYNTYEDVALDFGVNAPEALAAALYFGQSSKPGTLMIGRWLRTASPAENIGGILSTAEKLITNFSSISDGSFSIEIDGVNQDLTGLDFSSETNLNGVASVISAALTGATCVWDGSKFVITSDSTGAGVKASGTITLDDNPAFGVRADGSLEFTGQPGAGEQVEIEGTTITFVAGSPGALQVQIGATTADTAQNLFNFLQASADANLALMTYSKVGNEIFITARVYGTAGNAYTLSTTAANITVSGATLSGGLDPDELEINGVTYTFVESNPGATEILVGPTKTQTAANIQAKLAASTNPSVAEASYTRTDEVITVEYDEVGTAGNAFTLAATSSAITLSGANLTGGAGGSEVGYATVEGTGTDISSQLKLAQSLNIALVPGYDAETPAECAAVLANASSAWYGLMFRASVQPTNEQSLAVSDVIEALDLKRIYGSTIIDANVLSSLVSNDLASLQKDAGYLRSFCQYSENPQAIASFFGRAFSVNFAANRSTIIMMYKQEPGVAAQDLTSTQATTLQDKRCNVFVEYVNNTNIIQYGTMSGPAWFDEIHGLDWLQDAIQNACYNLLYTSTTKVPQTDAGVNQLVTAISGVCDEAVNNGLVAPGTWTGPEFGQLKTNQYLKSGYYIYAQPLALQSQADREARIAPPIQVGIKLAGGIQEVDVIIEVNR